VRLDIVLISTADFPAMLAFYRDVLGLRLIEDEDPDPAVHEPGVDWAAFDAGGMRLELFGTAEAGPDDRDRVAIVPAFRVEKLADVVTELEERGVTFTERGQEAWGAYANLRDPDGNLLNLYEPDGS
jgi:catechol 2,3-dioxygenase-like lactoylglutathione lyase family enzyme